MERKLLVFSLLVSCLILFVSFGYYLYTGYRLRVENQSVQELITKLESPVVERRTAGASFQPSIPEHTNAPPTESKSFGRFFESTELEEMEETEIAALLDTFDEIEASGEWEADTTDGLLSRREREQLFTDLKPMITRRDEFWRAAMPLHNEVDRRSQRMREIGELSIGTSDDNTARLHDEWERHSARLDELYPILDSHHEEDKRMLKQIKQKVSEYGITNAEFWGQYWHTGIYNSWREAL